MSERVEGTRRAVATAGVLAGTFLAAVETTVVAAAMAMERNVAARLPACARCCTMKTPSSTPMG